MIICTILELFNKCEILLLIQILQIKEILLYCVMEAQAEPNLFSCPFLAFSEVGFFQISAK